MVDVWSTRSDPTAKYLRRVLFTNDAFSRNSNKKFYELRFFYARKIQADIKYLSKLCPINFGTFVVFKNETKLLKIWTEFSQFFLHKFILSSPYNSLTFTEGSEVSIAFNNFSL